MQARTVPLKNPLLSDVCISTSAAPTYLPAYYFQTKDDSNGTREFNLVDGGVIANNPVSDIDFIVTKIIFREFKIYCGAI